MTTQEISLLFSKEEKNYLKLKEENYKKIISAKLT
jgi:hypothetical protein